MQHAVEDLMAQGRRRRFVILHPFTLGPFRTNSRLLAPTAAIRRTIIRHLIVLLDLSCSMMDRDMRPTRFDLTLEYTRVFISEWFDQNPLGQIGLVGMRGGVGERIGEMAGTSYQTALSGSKFT